jgi:hypothetical protein
MENKSLQLILAQLELINKKYVELINQLRNVIQEN